MKQRMWTEPTNKTDNDYITMLQTSSSSSSSSFSEEQGVFRPVGWTAGGSVRRPQKEFS